MERCGLEILICESCKYSDISDHANQYAREELQEVGCTTCSGLADEEEQISRDREGMARKRTKGICCSGYQEKKVFWGESSNQSFDMLL